MYDYAKSHLLVNGDTYRIQTIISACRSAKVEHVVVSPGSRSAPLSLGFARTKNMQIHSVVHEGSAAFVALGLALYTGNSVVLICTSGSAGLHYTAAIAEAFYQEAPLLVLTADRPAAWIGQQDGQTLPQTGMYGSLVKNSFNLPELHSSTHKEDQWHIRRTMSDALLLTQLLPAGPVHVNVPLRPPLYASTVATEEDVLPQRYCLPYERVLLPKSWQCIQDLFQKYKKVLVLCGQSAFDKNISRRVDDFLQQQSIPLLGDVLSNLHGLSCLVRYGELFLGELDRSLQPDLLISFGNHILSKATKSFLRRYPPKAHLRLYPYDLPSSDPLQCLTHQVPLTASHFFLDAKANLPPSHRRARAAFLKRWQEADKVARSQLEEKLLDVPFCQFRAVQIILSQLPHHIHLHLGNSMPVRYVNYLSLSSEQEGVEVFANRGTCGIDGCLSTSIGVCKGSDYVLNVLLIGDISFLHDQGGLLNSPLPVEFTYSFI